MFNTKFVLKCGWILCCGFILMACGNQDNNQNHDPIVVVFYPNESGSEFEPIRNEVERLIYEATGRSTEAMITVDYNIAIEAIASGVADLAFMGPSGYKIANDMNSDVQAIFTYSGPTGTLDGAVYFSFLAVREEEVHFWENGEGGFDLEGLRGATFSFVSNTSTSGFVVPGNAIVDMFDLDSMDDLAISGHFFDRVLFGGSHQVSAFNVITGEADVAAFMNNETTFEIVGGQNNQTGMIYQVREGAEAPFDQLAGERLVIIKSIPVPNSPIAANFNTLTETEIETIVAIFTSDEVAEHPNFFGDPDSDIISLEIRHTGYERFVPVSDDFYNVLR